MVKLTVDQINFLIANEEAITLEEFASQFKCTWKEVYKIYDIITKTQRYRDYVQKRTEKICKKIIKGCDCKEVETWTSP